MEVVLSEEIPDKSHIATSNRRGSLWNWGSESWGCTGTGLRLSPCSPRWRTCPLEWSRRQRTDCVRLPREATTPSGWDCWDETKHPLSHSRLREDGWEWEESQTYPEGEIIPVSCWTERWNEFPLDCEYTQLPCCCGNIHEQSDYATVVPTEVWLISLLQVPASWYAVRTPEVTNVLRDDRSAYWLLILSATHQWRTR